MFFGNTYIKTLNLLCLLVFMQLLSCKTTDTSNAIVDGTDVEDLETTGEDDGAIPLSLWSPAQRRANAGYYFLVAESKKLKDPQSSRAKELYEAAYNLDPNAFLGAKMVASISNTGQIAEAVEYAQRLALLYPQDAEMHLLLGQLYSKQGRLSAAENKLEKALDINSKFEEAYIELISILMHKQELAKAVAVAKEMTVKVPESVFGWATLAKLYLQSNRYKAALKPAKRAWEMQSSNPHFAQVYAIVLQLNDKKKQAVKLYEQLYRLNPADDSVTRQMIGLYRDLGNLEDALELIDEMSDLSEKIRPSIQMQKAIILWELEKLDDALKTLIALSKDYPDSDNIQYMLGMAYERTGKPDKAIEIYEKIHEASKFRYHSDYRMVYLLRKDKRIPDALKVGQRLLDSQYVEWDAYITVAGVYSDKSAYDDAIKLLESGYDKFPSQHRLLFWKGVYQEKAGDIKDCIETMRSVIKVDPDNSSPYNYLGYLFAERKENLEEAEKLIKKALELKPNDGFYLDSLGWVYFQMGKYKKARPMLEKALELEPEEGVIMEHVGDLVKAEGDSTKAKSYYQKALEMNLEDKDRDRIKKKLNSADK